MNKININEIREQTKKAELLFADFDCDINNCSRVGENKCRRLISNQKVEDVIDHYSELGFTVEKENVNGLFGQMSKDKSFVTVRW